MGWVLSRRQAKGKGVLRLAHSETHPNRTWNPLHTTAPRTERGLPSARTENPLHDVLHRSLYSRHTTHSERHASPEKFSEPHMEPIGLVSLFPGWGFPSHDPDKLLCFSDILDAMQLTCIFCRPDVSSFPVHGCPHCTLSERECADTKKLGGRKSHERSYCRSAAEK